MKEKLTTKQEKFIQNIVRGMSQREAYKDAYNAENMKDETIDVQASKLFNNDKISIRYQELMEELKDEAIMSAKERMIWLTEVVKGIQMEDKTEWTDGESYTYQRAADLNTKIKALDTLNKMEGVYVNNHKISGDQKNPLNIVDLSHLTTEEIRELLDNERKE